MKVDANLLSDLGPLGHEHINLRLVSPGMAFVKGVRATCGFIGNAIRMNVQQTLMLILSG